MDPGKSGRRKKEALDFLVPLFQFILVHINYFASLTTRNGTRNVRKQ